MIQFQHNGNASYDEITKSENDFKIMLGDFIEEFESKKPFVTFNYNETIESGNRFSFVFNTGNADDLFDFINRFQQAKKSTK